MTDGASARKAMLRSCGARGTLSALRHICPRFHLQSENWRQKTLKYECCLGPKRDSTLRL